MVERQRIAADLDMVGGRLCLDFTNTVNTRIEGLRREYLTDYNALVAWARHAGVLSEKIGKALLQRAARRPDEAAAALDRAIALREAIYRVFSAIAHKEKPEKADLQVLNSFLREALSRMEVLPSGKGFGWGWATDKEDLHQAIWPVVRSAAGLLTSDDLGRVKECAREGCDWLFVDMSKNRRRRWCSMTMCGSRIKARSYYRRRRERWRSPTS